MSACYMSVNLQYNELIGFLHHFGSFQGSGVTRSMVTPGPETEVIGESGSGGLGA